MTTSRRGAALFAVALLTVSGCNCSNNSAATGDGGQVDLEGLRRVYAEMCGLIARCPQMTSGYSIAYRDLSECVDILQFFTTCRLTEKEDPAGDEVYGVEQVFPDFSPAEAQACAAWLKQASCEAVQTPCKTDGGCNPCGDLFASSADEGDDGNSGERKAGLDERCDRLACADGLYCAPGMKAGDAGETCRVCKPKRKAGGDCVDPPYVPCGAGLFCSADGGACVALLADGTGCAGSHECQSGFCNPAQKTCDPGGHAGEACSAKEDCREGFCDTAAAKCSALLANGASCTAAEQCQAWHCDTASARCGKPDGTACYSASECQSGACLSRLCGAPKAEGESCAESDECASRYCDYSTKRCVLRCSGDEDCATGEFCDFWSNRCQARRANGSGCEDDEECQSGFCNQAEQCAVKPGLGGACRGSSDCQPVGYCSGGVCKAFEPPGAACTGYESCQAPFLCLSGTCTRMGLTCAPAAPGQMCTWLMVCDQTSYCDPLSSFTCKAKKPAGSSCRQSAECPATQYCDRGTCSDWAKAGDDCDRKACAAGLFCDESVAPPRCTAPKADGEACTDETQCLSGICDYDSGYSQRVCGGAACVMPPPGELPACHPKTCVEEGLSCGLLDDDGCGRSTQCGTCSGYETCGGGGTPGACGCTPQVTCGPRDCGTVDDGCGHQVTCNEGKCPTGQSCGGAGGTLGVCGCYGDEKAGPRTASAGADFAVNAGFVAWQEVDKVAAEDGAGAHVTLQKESFSGAIHISEHLVAKGFGFALPPTASVYAIQVQIVRKASTPDDVEDHQVQLFLDGQLVGRASGGSGERWSDAWTTQDYGAMLWGRGWTVEEINSPEFGVALTVIGPMSNASAEALVDTVRVTVVYEHDCSCDYQCAPGYECGDDGCGGTCGSGCSGADTCSGNYCTPPIYVDSATGLMWQNSGSYGTDQNACIGKDLGGYTDWRVPTIDELRTLVNGCAATAPGGACGVTAACTSQATCWDASCDGCAAGAGPGPYGSYAPLHLVHPTNSSMMSKSRDGTAFYWGLHLGKADLVTLSNSSWGHIVRCVRGP